VHSLQSFIQQQYSVVANVYNDNNGTTPCGASASPRGQSNCVILGRYVTVTPVGVRSSRALVRTITGTIPTVGSPEVLNDVQVFTSIGDGTNHGYNIILMPSASDSVNYDLEWDATMVKPGSNDPISFSLMILRSPSSGFIKTFINPTSVVSDGQIQNNLVQVPASLTNPLKICVNDFDLSTSAKRALFINAGVSSASGVELLDEATGGC
jgi:hypothetical protein